MFLRRRGQPGEESVASSLTAVRDVVEIVAIVAAGGWAFYTFVYQNEIKPANSPPLVQFDATMTRLGARRGFEAVQSHITLRNEGVTNVWFYGIAETALGSTIQPRPQSKAQVLEERSSSIELEPGWIDDRATPVYGLGILTELADPRSTTQITLTPGQSMPIDRVFYVRAGKFDELQLHIALRYSAHPKPMPCHLATIDGLTELVASKADDASDDSNEVAGTPATLSLW